MKRTIRLEFVLGVCGGMAVLAASGVFFVAGCGKKSRNVASKPAQADSQPAAPGTTALGSTTPSQPEPPGATSSVAEQIARSMKWSDVTSLEVAMDTTKMSHKDLFSHPYRTIDPTDETLVVEGDGLQELTQPAALHATLILKRSPWTAGSVAALGKPDKQEAGSILREDEYGFRQEVKLEWRWWSWAALGIDGAGECRSVRIDATGWRKRIAAKDLNPATTKSAGAADSSRSDHSASKKETERTAIAGGAGGLRFDGLYYAKQGDSLSVYRFLSDGRLVQAIVPVKPDDKVEQVLTQQVATWLKVDPSSKSLMVGGYSINDHAISLGVNRRNKMGNSEVKGQAGTIREGMLTISGEPFTFVHAAFPKN